jgi:histidyl-tRNA synthetase
VPVPDAVAVARETREQAGPGRVVETVRRSGKFGAQLKRLEAAGFTGFVLVRSESEAEGGAIVRGELRALGGDQGA